MSTTFWNYETVIAKPHVSVTLSRGRDVLAQWNEPITSTTDRFTEPLHRIKEQINTYLSDLIVEKSSGSDLTDDKCSEYLASDDSDDSLQKVTQAVNNKGDNTVVVKSPSDNINERVKRLKK